MNAPFRIEPRPFPAASEPMNLRQKAKAATRDKAVRVARNLFNIMGYDGVGIRDIALGMGMSTGAVFANFKDKETLWCEAMGRPVPGRELADAANQVRAALPGWTWTLRLEREGAHVAAVCSPDFNPVEQQGLNFVGRGVYPHEALQHALRRAVTRAPSQ